MPASGSKRQGASSSSPSSKPRNVLGAYKRELVRQLRAADPSTLPFLRAYLIGFVSSTIPQIIRIVVGYVTRARSVKSHASLTSALRQLFDALVHGASPYGLATAFGISVGGAKWGETRVEPAVRAVYHRIPSKWRARLGHKQVNDGKVKRDRGTTGYLIEGEDVLEQETARDEVIVKAVSTFVSGTLASLISIILLHNRPRNPKQKRSKQPKPEVEIGFSPYPDIGPGPPKPTKRPSTRRRVTQSPTLDLTLFALVRATDVLVRGIYEWSAITKGRWGSVASVIGQNADTLLFGLSCWRIMHCWFYLPERLPASYNKWILTLARMDPKLLQLLQYARAGEYVYGQKPNAEVLKMCQAIAASAGSETRFVNPELIKRLDCTFVHGKIGAGSCEANAIKRWIAAFRDCLFIYLPVHLVPQLLFNLGRITQSPLSSLLHILLAASRSSAFLATFVASIYASVCLVRTRLPMVLPVRQQLLDGGWCTGLGCFLCGLSVLIENKRRRREMALYCAPRALYATMEEIVPSFLSRGKAGKVLSKYLERLVFAASTGTVISATVHRPDLVSGVVSGVAGFAVGSWGRSKK